MSLGREDATRILRFCLAGDGWGSAIHEDGLCVVRVARASGAAGAGGTDVRRFEGATFEEAMRQAAAMGALKSSCVEKQIAFLARSLPEPRPAPPGAEVGAAGGNGGANSETDRKDGRPGAVTSALFPSVAGALSALIHELQRERGRSSLYVSSCGRLFGRELVEQWRLTDERRAELSSFRERHASRLPDLALQRLDHADALLSKLIPARKRVEVQELAAERIIESYTMVNVELLGVSDVLATDGVERPLRPTAIAWMALLYAKEMLGIERAEVASAFAYDRWAEAQRMTVTALIAGRRSYLHLLSASAPKRAVRLLERGLASDTVAALERLERMALSRGEGFGVDPVDWFTAATRKMDLLGEVEAAILGSIA